jgi:hypothetical protein
MAPDEAAQRFLEQMAENRFWVCSHPDMTTDLLGARAAFLSGRSPPVMPDLARTIAME